MDFDIGFGYSWDFLAIFWLWVGVPRASQVVLMVKNPPANTGDVRDCGFGPWVRKTPWRRVWQPTPVFLPEESRGQRSLAGHRL